MSTGETDRTRIGCASKVVKPGFENGSGSALVRRAVAFLICSIALLFASCTGDETKAVQEIPYDESFGWTFPWSKSINGGLAEVDMAGNEWSKIWATDFPLQVLMEAAVNGKYILFLGFKEWTQMSTERDVPTRINLLCYNIHDGKLEFELELETEGDDRIIPISGRAEALLVLNEVLHIVDLESGDLRELKGTPMQGACGEATQVSSDEIVVTTFEPPPLDSYRKANVWLYAVNLSTNEVTELSDLNPASTAINSFGDGNFFYFEELASIACINLESGTRLWRTSLPIAVDPEDADSNLSDHREIVAYGGRVYVPLETSLHVFDASSGELLYNLSDLPTGVLHLVVDEHRIAWAILTDERAIRVIDLETGDVVFNFGPDTPYASRDGVVIRITPDTAVKVYDEIGGEFVKGFHMRTDFGAFLIDSAGGVVLVEPNNKLTRYK